LDFQAASRLHPQQQAQLKATRSSHLLWWRAVDTVCSCQRTPCQGNIAPAAPHLTDASRLSTSHQAAPSTSATKMPNVVLTCSTRKCCHSVQLPGASGACKGGWEPPRRVGDAEVTRRGVHPCFPLPKQHTVGAVTGLPPDPASQHAQPSTQLPRVPQTDGSASRDRSNTAPAAVSQREAQRLDAQPAPGLGGV